MAKNWDRYSRHGLDIAFGVTSVGFHAAKAGTRLGFSVARGIASTAAGVTSFALDQAVFGGAPVTTPVLQRAVSTVLSVAEQCTLAPIYLGEYITTTSVLAAHSSINALSVILPGSSEASFSLASFIDLVRREWSEQGQDPNRPKKMYGITKVAWAIVGWASLQGVTQEWQEKRWLKHLKEIHIKDVYEPTRSAAPSIRSTSSRVRVTSDVIFPGQGGAQIITANIGEGRWPILNRTKSKASLRSSMFSHVSMSTVSEPDDSLPIPELKANLRRLSKLVLAGYGGASLLFFGISPMQLYASKASPLSAADKLTPPSADECIQNEKSIEEAKLATAIDASEAEASGDGVEEPPVPEPDTFRQYSWWDIILGKHDQEIFENTMHQHPHDNPPKGRLTALKGKIRSRAVIGNQHLMPRFWVLTDYHREEIVLVIRGTMSLNEIAADLTCEPESFKPAQTPLPTEQSQYQVPGQFKFPPKYREQRASDKQYHVHGGMLRLAKAMGDLGKPVQLAVMEALHSNPDFDLILCGHSLGAGVAALLGMIWADPETCLTVPSSGLPVGRRVQVYCFAPPALTDAALSRLADKLIVSFVYSHDVVSRLSLGSIRDLRNAAMWLCEENENGTEAGYTAVSKRARAWKGCQGTSHDMKWFIATRKTLEANMQNRDMFPTGRVLWAFRDGDFHPAHQRFPDDKAKLRLFEVQDVQEVFSQLVFAQNMLSAHMPHKYDQILHELL